MRPMKRSVTKLRLPSRSNVISSFSKNLLFQNLHNIDELYIVLDDPHKVYRPGDYVTGAVVLLVKKPLVNIVVSLSINGVIKVGPTSNGITSKKAKLFSIAISLYGEDADNVENVSGLSKGEHRFPFSIKLPRRNIYSSIRFEKGSISYSLKAHIYHKAQQECTAKLGDRRSGIGNVRSGIMNNGGKNGNGVCNSKVCSHGIGNSNNGIGNNKTDINEIDNNKTDINGIDNNKTDINEIGNNKTDIDEIDNNNTDNNGIDNNNNKTDNNSTNNNPPNNLTNNNPPNNPTNNSKTNINPTNNNTNINPTNNNTNINPTNNTPTNNTPTNNSPTNNTQTPNLYDTIAKCEKNLTIECPINVLKFPMPKTSLLLIKSPQKRFLKNLSSSSTINSSNSIKSNNSNGSDTGENDSNSSIINNISGSFFAKNSSNPNLNHSMIRLAVNTPSIAYLPNDLVPVQVHLQHIKNVKSLNGIIITLIRICKIDSGPDGSVQSFRKDLSQVVKPLYIDPTSLESQVNTNIRVPYDIFPTIRGAPLLSFEYYIEVVVNLTNKNMSDDNGKAYDQVKSRSKAEGKFENGFISKKFRSRNSNELNGKNGIDDTASNINTHIINVDKLKRFKNVISLSRRIVIGTERIDFPSKQLPNPKKQTNDTLRVPADNTAVPVITSTSSSPSNDLQNEPAPTIIRSGFNSDIYPANELQNHTISFAPPPPLLEDIQENPHLSEKERIRRHEESLLPSEPEMLYDPNHIVHTTPLVPVLEDDLETNSDSVDAGHPTGISVSNDLSVGNNNLGTTTAVLHNLTIQHDSINEDTHNISAVLEDEVTDYVPEYQPSYNTPSNSPATVDPVTANEVSS